MILNVEMRQRLNLLASNKHFVFKQTSEDGSAMLLTPTVVPSDGVYWLSGSTKLPIGREIESVFCVETSSGGDLLAVYWKINEQWYEHDSNETFSTLGIERAQAFPFEWAYNVAVEGDVFHPT